MEKVFIKKNTLGDTRTTEHMPSREEFNDANERHIYDVKNLTRSVIVYELDGANNESIPEWQKEIEEEYEWLHWDIR